VGVECPPTADDRRRSSRATEPGDVPAARVGGRRLLAHAWKATLVLAIVAGGLWTATHRVAGVAWPDVATVLRNVAPHQLLVLALIWAAGLGIYSLVLSAALPGLGVPRSLLLNLSGSAVANVVPLGGAVGTALNWRMVTRWGHSNTAFAAYCLLTNALDVLTKLVLPLVAVTGLVMVSGHVPAGMWAMAGCCAAVLVLAVLLEPLVRRVSGRTATGRHFGGRLRQQVRDSRERIREIFSVGWARLLSGSAGYIAAQVALLDVSLHTVGLHPPLTVVIMAAAVERLGTLVPITPGGAGVAEIGAIAWLVGTGLGPVEVVAGVLLCRIFLVAMEIPVGAFLLAGWVWWQRTTRGQLRPGVHA
jgi:uncharacterized membrane protein YbhN (UPF0104 family)